VADEKQRALQQLKELRAEADTIDYSWEDTEKLKRWKLAAESALRHLFDEKSTFLGEFGIISWYPQVVYNGTPKSEWVGQFMRGLSESKAVMSAAIQEAEDYGIGQEPREREVVVPATAFARKAFVVHGHDNEMKETVARFLEKIEIEPIILHEQANLGQTIIEKIASNADVPFTIVLLSPDDVGAAVNDRDNLQPRARQNVVLELGYFLGKSRSRVCALVRSRIELPSDIHGIVYVPFEGDTWKIQIVRELKALGIDVDANKAFQAG
jgi:predicted nucleotide-binding protein